MKESEFILGRFLHRWTRGRDPEYLNLNTGVPTPHVTGHLTPLTPGPPGTGQAPPS